MVSYYRLRTMRTGEGCTLEAFINGFLIWWGTGMDDLIVLITLLMGAHALRQRLSIAAGTLIGVCLMFMASLILPLTLSKGLSEVGLDLSILRFCGVIPIGFGLKTIHGVIVDLMNSEEDEEDEPRRVNGLFVSALVIYLGNATDDFFVTTSALAGQDPWFGLYLLGGILTGCIVAIVSANALRTILARWQTQLSLLGGVLLIAIGVGIFLN